MRGALHYFHCDKSFVSEQKVTSKREGKHCWVSTSAPVCYFIAAVQVKINKQGQFSASSITLHICGAGSPSRLFANFKQHHILPSQVVMDYTNKTNPT